MILNDLIQTARQKHQIISCAESCTGGLLAAALTQQPGASDIFDCGFITYSNKSKQRLLGVRTQTLADFGSVSRETAKEMAIGALTHSHATIAIAITGIAGPGSSGHKPEGRVCFALAMPHHVQSWLMEFGPLGRENVRNAARDYALFLLHRMITHPDFHESGVTFDI